MVRHPCRSASHAASIPRDQWMSSHTMHPPGASMGRNRWTYLRIASPSWCPSRKIRSHCRRGTSASHAARASSNGITVSAIDSCMPVRSQPSAARCAMPGCPSTVCTRKPAAANCAAVTPRQVPSSSTSCAPTARPRATSARTCPGGLSATCASFPTVLRRTVRLPAPGSYPSTALASPRIRRRSVSTPAWSATARTPSSQAYSNGACIPCRPRAPHRHRTKRTIRGPQT